MTLPRVLVLHNEPTLPESHPDADSEYDVLDTVECIAQIYGQAGLSVERFGFQHDLRQMLDAVERLRPDVIFNLYEGTAIWPHSEAFVAAALEMTRIPFTGSPAAAIMLARSKTHTKHLLHGAGLPTPRFRDAAADGAAANDLGWPVIVKPSLEDASVGIDQNSVVTNAGDLAARVEYLRQHYGPAVHFEEFIRGREFHVSLLERDGVLRALPFSEIFFHEALADESLWPIVSFDAKWHDESRDFIATPVKNPADVDPELERRVSDVARAAFRLVGCRDYARLDFRIAADGTPYILEVNPNPCISPLAGVAEALTSAGIDFPEFALILIRSALRRGPCPRLADFPLKMPTAEISVPLPESA